MKHHKFIAFNIETTSVDINTCELVKIDAIKYKNQKVKERFSTFINPNKHLDNEILNILNINQKDLDSAPQLTQAIKKLKRFIKRYLLIGYNSQNFDIPVLSRFTKIKNKNIDVLNMAKENLKLNSYRLHDVAKKLSLTIKDNDTESIADIYISLQNQK